jgi:hypothetical protein
MEKTFSFEEFQTQFQAQREIKIPKTKTERINEALVKTQDLERKYSLWPEQIEEAYRLRSNLFFLAAQSTKTDITTDLEHTLDQLQRLGIETTKETVIKSSIRSFAEEPLEVIRDAYNEYLDSIRMRQREIRQAERFQKFIAEQN